MWPFAGQEPRGWRSESDPARTGQIHFGPRRANRKKSWLAPAGAIERFYGPAQAESGKPDANRAASPAMDAAPATSSHAPVPARAASGRRAYVSGGWIPGSSRMTYLMIWCSFAFRSTRN